MMGMHGYTTVHLLPGERLWVPDMGMLRTMLEYFTPTSVSVLGKDGPEYWDADEPPKCTHALRDVSVAQALSQYRSHQAPGTMFLLDGSPWSSRVCDSITATIPSEIADGYQAWDVHAWVGLRTIPDHALERTVVETMFDLTISGDGMPADMPRYLELLLKTPEMQDLSRSLTGLTSQLWQALISASY